MNEALKNSTDGAKVGGQLVVAIRFADDQAMVASSNTGLQRIMNMLDTTSGNYGMIVNFKKDNSYDNRQSGRKSGLVSQ